MPAAGVLHQGNGAARLGLRLKLTRSLDTSAPAGARGAQGEPMEEGELTLQAPPDGTVPVSYTLSSTAPPGEAAATFQSLPEKNIVLISHSRAEVELAAASWELGPADRTLNAALARWAAKAGWQLVWELPVDYAVDSRTVVSGTFQQAVGLVAQGMAGAEIPLKAIFYAGNKVLRIVAQGAE
ncbi:TcpQ domain-containing protein [Oxalobacteraceae bacterium]|nr:TcpQ domain-containing protein [Oxalobacteraceae bacterium]